MSYPLHPCSIPNDVAAEPAADPADDLALGHIAAEEAARQAARERIVAAVRGRAAEAASGAGLTDGAADGAAQGEGAGSAFGRGWIPASRDIGLPGEDMLHAVAPAEAGAHPELAAGADLGFRDRGRDGPLPPQGRRGEGASGLEGDQVSRIWRSIDFTPPRRAMFLHQLAQEGNVRVAAARVGVSPTSAYLARRRDAVFRAGWDAALVQSREHALQVLANHALDGIREEVWHRGELVGHRVRHDSRLLLAHLGRLDARCQDARALARAERFDELLALVAGEDYSWALCDDRPGADGKVAGGKGAGDEILPLTRADHSNRAAGMAYGGAPYDEPEQIDQDELIAREVAEGEWDDWGGRVGAVNDALEAGEEPVVSPAPPEPPEPDLEAGAEPPFEVKSLDGGRALRPGGRGRDYFARTVCGSSTWSVRGAEIGGRAAFLRSSPARGGVAPQA